MIAYEIFQQEGFIYVTSLSLECKVKFTDKWVGKKGIVSGNHDFDKACTDENIEELRADLSKFLLFYLFSRRHGSLRKELGAKVRTHFDAMQSWFILKPELFKISPDVFQANAFEKLEQRGET